MAIKARKLFENMSHIYWSLNFVMFFVADVYYIDFIWFLLLFSRCQNIIIQIWSVCQSARSFNSLSNIGYVESLIDFKLKVALFKYFCQPYTWEIK